ADVGDHLRGFALAGRAQPGLPADHCRGCRRHQLRRGAALSTAWGAAPAAPRPDFLQTIVEPAAGTNFAVVLNYRPSWSCPWLGLPHYQQLALAELDHGDVERLVRDLVGDDPALTKTIADVARKSDGNPFFA